MPIEITDNQKTLLKEIEGGMHILPATGQETAADLLDKSTKYEMSVPQWNLIQSLADQCAKRIPIKESNGPVKDLDVFFEWAVEERKVGIEWPEIKMDVAGQNVVIKPGTNIEVQGINITDGGEYGSNVFMGKIKRGRNNEVIWFPTKDTTKEVRQAVIDKAEALKNATVAGDLDDEIPF